MPRIHETGLSVLTDAGEIGQWGNRTTPIVTETGRVVHITDDVVPDPEPPVAFRSVQNIRIPQMSRGEH